MRKILVVAVIMAACGAAQAVDMEEYAFMDGLISFKAPAGWVVEHDETITGVTIAPRANSTSMVVFSTPNPHYDGDLATYLGENLGIFFAVVGGGEVVKEEETEVGGYAGVMAYFAANYGDDDVVGFSFAFDVADYVVMVTAFAPERDKMFLRSVEEILDSYHLDVDMLDEWRETLDEIGMNIADQMGALLGK